MISNCQPNIKKVVDKSAGMCYTISERIDTYET